MENKSPELVHEGWSEKISDLRRVFGEDFTKLLDQIHHDNPALDNEEIILQAWSLIPEATAYMQPADYEALLENAILIHESHEAFRRIRD